MRNERVLSVDLLHKCEQLLRERAPVTEDKQRLHHPVMVILDHAAASMDENLRRTFSRQLKFPDAVSFLISDYDGLPKDGFDSCYVSMANQEGVYQDYTTLDIHCVLSSSSDWNHLLQFCQNIDNFRTLSITIFWYLLLDESSAATREQSRQLVEEFQRSCQDCLLIKHSVFVLSNTYHNGAMLNPMRCQGLNEFIIANLVLLTGIESDKAQFNAQLLQTQYKTVASQCLELPLSEITAVTLRAIVARAIPKSLSEEQAENLLGDKLDWKNRRCMLLERQFGILRFPSGKDLYQIPHKKSAWKKLRKQKSWNDELLQEATNGNWDLYFEQARCRALESIDTATITDAFLKEISQIEESTTFTFALGVTDRLLRELELRFGDKQSFSYVPVGASMTERLTYYFTERCKYESYQTLLPILLDTLRKLRDDGKAWLNYLQTQMKTVEATDNFIYASTGSSGVMTVYSAVVDELTEREVDWQSLQHAGTEATLLYVFSQIIAKSPQYALPFDDEFFSRYQSHEGLDKNNFLYEQLMKDISASQRLRTAESPSVVLDCFVGELTDELKRRLLGETENKHVLSIEKLNSLNRITIYELKPPIHLL